MAVARVHSSPVFTCWSTRDAFITASLKTPPDTLTNARTHTCSHIDKGLKFSEACTYSWACRCYWEWILFCTGARVYITEPLFISWFTSWHHSWTVCCRSTYWPTIAYKWSFFLTESLKVVCMWSCFHRHVNCGQTIWRNRGLSHWAFVGAPQHDFN